MSASIAGFGPRRSTKGTSGDALACNCEQTTVQPRVAVPHHGQAAQNHRFLVERARCLLAGAVESASGQTRFCRSVVGVHAAAPTLVTSQSGEIEWPPGRATDLQLVHALHFAEIYVKGVAPDMGRNFRVVFKHEGSRIPAASWRENASIPKRFAGPSVSPRWRFAPSPARASSRRAF